MTELPKVDTADDVCVPRPSTPTGALATLSVIKGSVLNKSDDSDPELRNKMKFTLSATDEDDGLPRTPGREITIHFDCETSTSSLAKPSMSIPAAPPTPGKQEIPVVIRSPVLEHAVLMKTPSEDGPPRTPGRDFVADPIKGLTPSLSTDTIPGSEGPLTGNSLTMSSPRIPGSPFMYPSQSPGVNSGVPRTPGRDFNFAAFPETNTATVSPLLASKKSSLDEEKEKLIHKEPSSTTPLISVNSVLSTPLPLPVTLITPPSFPMELGLLPDSALSPLIKSATVPNNKEKLEEEIKPEAEKVLVLSEPAPSLPLGIVPNEKLPHHKIAYTKEKHAPQAPVPALDSQLKEEPMVNIANQLRPPLQAGTDEADTKDLGCTRVHDHVGLKDPAAAILDSWDESGVNYTGTPEECRSKKQQKESDRLIPKELQTKIKIEDEDDEDEEYEVKQKAKFKEQWTRRHRKKYDEWYDDLPSSDSSPPRSLFKPRSEFEEMTILYDIWNEGMDEEDIKFMKITYDRMLLQDNCMDCLNDTLWVHHPYILSGYYIYLC